MATSGLILWALAGLLTLCSAVPLLKIAHGAVHGLAFMRQQFFLLALVLIAFAIFLPVPSRTLLILLLSACALFQALYIIKFTPIWKTQSVPATDAQIAEPYSQLTVLVANVKLSNRAYDRLIALTQAKKPDILLAIEVDDTWIAALHEGLAQTYQHHIDVPLTNGYGLCVLSRLDLSETEVRELVTDGVPSIKTTVKLPNASDLRLYVVHPEPPVVNHDTKGRDGEIALIGMEAAKDPLPAIVTGDLNDVAWSTTTRRFQRLSKLLDPRVGRGFYNTFSATMPLMRWPLDHLFHDARFRLIAMDRLPKIGSDHFPMWFALALAEQPKRNSDPGSSDIEERSEVVGMIISEQKRDREAIGSDWEDG